MSTSDKLLTWDSLGILLLSSKALQRNKCIDLAPIQCFPYVNKKCDNIATSTAIDSFPGLLEEYLEGHDYVL